MENVYRKNFLNKRINGKRLYISPNFLRSIQNPSAFENYLSASKNVKVKIQLLETSRKCRWSGRNIQRKADHQFWLEKKNNTDKKCTNLFTFIESTKRKKSCSKNINQESLMTITKTFSMPKGENIFIGQNKAINPNYFSMSLMKIVVSSQTFKNDLLLIGWTY